MLTFPEHMSSQPVFIGVLVAQSLVFCVAFCRLLFVFFVGFVLILPLYCLYFSLRFLGTSLASSNVSCWFISGKKEIKTFH